MLIQTKSRSDAYQAIINTWLKDQTLYCNNCGKSFDPLKDSPLCCDLPHIGKNIDHCKGLINQNKEMTKTRSNQYASVKNKTMRWGLSLPISLFYTLDRWKKDQNKPGLFREKGELQWFMRKFPMFRIPEKV